MDQNSGRQAGRLVLEAQPRLGIPALYVHDLTGTPDAERLLSKPPRVHPATPDILPRLRQFCPEIAAKLVGKDDTVKQIPLKLITTSQFWFPGVIQSFVAISYCWHSDEWRVSNRFSGDREDWNFPVSPAMLNAILQHHLANSGKTSCLAIWIDQICIDQQNVKEKTHTVANMDVIYRNAFEVNVLLEDVDLSPEEESVLGLLYKGGKPVDLHDFFHLGGYEIQTNVKFCIDNDYGDALICLVTKIFQSRWFSRAWCRHEYMLNSNANFIVIGWKCAFITLEPNAFRGFLSELEERDIDPGELNFLQGFQDFSFGINLESTDYSFNECLFERFVQLQLLGCTYQRDIISISLNASGIRLTFNGDVARRRESRHVLAMIALGAGDASVLGGEGLPMYRMDCPGHQPLLCWPREYETDWSALNSYSMPRTCDDARIWDITAEKTSLDAIVLLSHPSSPPKESRDCAAEIWSWLTENQIIPDNDFVGLHSEDPDDTMIDILSCALALGLRWIDIASRYLNESRLISEHVHISESQCQMLIAKIISYCPGNEGGLTVYDVSSSFRIAATMLRLATCDYWFANIEGTTPLTVSLNSVGTEWAILLVPKHLAREVSDGKYHISVPVALNTLQALSVRRVWILEAAKTHDPPLAVIGRGFLIGQGDLNTEKHDSALYAERLTIVGPWRDDPFHEEDSSFGGWDTDDS